MSRLSINGAVPSVPMLSNQNHIRYYSAVGRILHGWVRAPEAWASRGIFSREFWKKKSCWSPHFLHSESHFNPHSPIKRTFAAREEVRAHPAHPLCLRAWYYRSWFMVFTSTTFLQLGVYYGKPYRNVAYPTAVGYATLFFRSMRQRDTINHRFQIVYRDTASPFQGLSINCRLPLL